MKIVIQAIPERLDNVNVLLNKFKTCSPIVYLDKEKKGVFNSFVECLKLSNNDYILCLQDDIFIANQLENYLAFLEKNMIKKNIEVLSLFSLKRNHVQEQFDLKINFATYPNFLMLQATIFSPKVSKMIIEYSKKSKQTKSSDLLVRDFLKETKINSYVHLPCLVQHSLNVKSSLGHPQSKSRQSPYFDANYIINKNND
jgi:GR25 family glycosyltransferase involved in LPS biosynthesis